MASKQVADRAKSSTLGANKARSNQPSLRLNPWCDCGRGLYCKVRREG
jgi:hypothetical protein